MSKPENTFIASIHRLMPPVDDLYHEKMYNPLRGGTPDVWYSGEADLWVEYKFILQPKRPDTSINVPGLFSALQLDWIARRIEEGRNVWAIVGCREGAVVMPNGEWLNRWTGAEFKKAVQPRPAVAAYLEKFLGYHR